MSFLFRRSLELNRPRKAKTEEQLLHQKKVADTDTGDDGNSNNVPELEPDPEQKPELDLDQEHKHKHESSASPIDDTGSGSEKTSLKKRPTFLQSLMRVSSGNGSSSSLKSSTSSSSSQLSGIPPLPPLVLADHKGNIKNRLLDIELATNIQSLLPARLQLFDTWDLVYSLSQHGMSLNTLYRNSKPEHQLQELKKRKKAEKGYADAVVKKMMVADFPKPGGFTIEQRRPQGYILVIKDEHNAKFGAYLNEYLKPMEHKRYYGNGECFLWKVENYDPSTLISHNEKSNQNSSESFSKNSATRFKAFMYTGINDNIIYSNRDFIAIGSSHGENGLYLDQSLSSGVSYPCETFGNEILCLNTKKNSKAGSFKIMGLEIWRVGTLE